MLSVTRFMRFMAATLVAITGLAFAGLQAQSPARAPRTRKDPPGRSNPRAVSRNLDRGRVDSDESEGPSSAGRWTGHDVSLGRARFLSGKLEDSTAKSRQEPVLLKISWTQRMQFLARTNGAGAQPVCVVPLSRESHRAVWRWLNRL